MVPYTWQIGLISSTRKKHSKYYNEAFHFIVHNILDLLPNVEEERIHHREGGRGEVKAKAKLEKKKYTRDLTLVVKSSSEESKKKKKCFSLHGITV